MVKGASTAPGKSSVATLRRLAQGQSASTVQERCELCSLLLAPRHRHLMKADNRQIICACDACALTFQNVEGGRFKLIPRDVRSLPGLTMSDGIWESLALPINLAFILHDSRSNKRVALYPSPAGATEALLAQEVWEQLAAENPPLKAMTSDVEALLVNRISGAEDYFIAPVDRCFELVGLIRRRWRGFHGGDTVWREMEDYFRSLRAEALVVDISGEDSHA